MNIFAHPPASGYTIPKMFRISQSFPRPKVEDLRATVFRELENIFPTDFPKGSKIAVTAGSRGISNIAEITRAAVDFLKLKGAAPFIIPAMGSHGGGTAEGQRKLIEHYGITEEAMGVPIRAEVETVALGVNADGVQPYFSKVAYESDGVLLLNRVKPHTDYKGEIESGLTKICAIGLGKLDGAREFHGHLFRLGLGGSIRSATASILATGKVLAGLALVENAYHETAEIHGVPANKLFEREKEILVSAKALMGRLPLSEMEVLLVDEMGKNMSGTGMDTNIIGRSIYGFQPGTAWVDGMPRIWRIVVDGISPESEGNAVGMGLADFVTDRFFRTINFRYTTLNALTGRSPLGAKLPVVYPNSRDAILAALATAPERSSGPRMVYIRDTLSLESVLVSEAAMLELKDKAGISIVGEEQLDFTTDGSLRSPFLSSH